MQKTYSYYFVTFLLTYCTAFAPSFASLQNTQLQQTTLAEWHNLLREEMYKSLDQATLLNYTLALHKDITQEIIDFAISKDYRLSDWLGLQEYLELYKTRKKCFTRQRIDLTRYNILKDSLSNTKQIFKGVDFQQAFFKNNLSDLHFQACHFGQAVMNNMYASNTILHECNLNKAQLNRTNFNHAIIMSSQCINIQCQKSNMTNASLMHINFLESNLTSTLFDHCIEFVDLDFTNALLRNATIIQPAIQNQRVNFTKADCSEAIFNDMYSLKNVIFDRTILKKSTLDPNLLKEGVIFKHSDLQEAKFTNTDKNKITESQKDTLTTSWLAKADLSQIKNLDKRTVEHVYLHDGKLSNTDMKKVSWALRYKKNKKNISLWYKKNKPAIHFGIQHGLYLIVSNYWAYRLHIGK